MKAWEIWNYKPPEWPADEKPHPAVIVSAPGRVANKLEINVLICSTQRATRLAQSHEVILDQADGLDWETLCRCDLLFLTAKSKLSQKRGQVSEERRRQIIATMIRANDWL